MTNKAKVFLSTKCTLNDNQKEVLNETFKDNWEIVDVPASSWDKKKQQELAFKYKDSSVVIVTPSSAPVFAITIARINDDVLVFHNDVITVTGVSKDNKVVHVVPETGWELV